MFRPHRRYEARKRSAIALIRYVLANDNPEVLPTHRHQLLDVLLWKLTEAEGGKHATRFKSSHADGCEDKKKLRHDHVFPRARMIADLERARTSNEVDRILETAVGCTVTAEEHERLSKFDKECDGWRRFERAEIAVINTETGERMEAAKTPEARKH